MQRIVSYFNFVCVTCALGREVHLPYYDHLSLRSRLITSPLSLLLTRIKGCYGSTTYPQLPPTSHSFLLSERSCQQISAPSDRPIQLHHLRRAHPPLPASCVDSVARPSLVIPKWTVICPGRAPVPTTTGTALTLSSDPPPGTPEIYVVMYFRRCEGRLALDWMYLRKFLSNCHDN